MKVIDAFVLLLPAILAAPIWSIHHQVVLNGLVRFLRRVVVLHRRGGGRPCRLGLAPTQTVHAVALGLHVQHLTVIISLQSRTRRGLAHGPLNSH